VEGMLEKDAGKREWVLEERVWDQEQIAVAGLATGVAGDQGSVVRGFAKTVARYTPRLGSPKNVSPPRSSCFVYLAQLGLSTRTRKQSDDTQQETIRLYCNRDLAVTRTSAENCRSGNAADNASDRER